MVPKSNCTGPQRRSETADEYPCLPMPVPECSPLTSRTMPPARRSDTTSIQCSRDFPQGRSACFLCITGKNTLHMIGLDEMGAIVLREKVSRNRIAIRLVNMPPCLIGIEAGMATHYMSRDLLALGHEVKQVPPAYAKPFRRPQERLPRRSRGCGSRATPFNALRSDKVRRSIGPSGASPPALSPDRRSDRCDQSGPWVSSGARHCREARTSLSAATAATDSSHAHRRPIASDAQDHWGHRRRLEISRRSHRKSNE
jgi:hypothetical protein